MHNWKAKLYATAYGPFEEQSEESDLEALELYERARQGLSTTLLEEES